MLFEDLEPTKNPKLGRLTTNRSGVSKILQSARLAAQEGLKYMWIDTCCIDKSSSAELSEAINSMFRWYLLSTVCYAYLADVDASPSNPDTTEDQLRQCRWFTRGWTLQELIAPGKLVLLDKSWTPFGTRASFVSTISNISEIPQHLLVSNAQHTSEDPNTGILRSLFRVSVSTRLSWAGRRQTKRVEDEAYSLMGLFGINMPLLYGEGKNAFWRLQIEIIRTSDDQSILAFRNPYRVYLRGRQHILAVSPSWFLSDIAVTRLPHEVTPMSWVNKGLELDVLLCSGQVMDTIDGTGHKYPYYVGILQCGIKNNHLSRTGLLLRPLENVNISSNWKRPHYFERASFQGGQVLLFDPDKGEVGVFCEGKSSWPHVRLGQKQY